MSLCLLVNEWLQREALRKGCLYAVVVDHALRKESSEEANSVREWLSLKGIHVVLHRLDWTGGTPRGAILQNTARLARRRVLLSTCLSINAPWLLLGHQITDQTETQLLRLARGSGAMGLRGMPDRQTLQCHSLARSLPLTDALLASQKDSVHALSLPFATRNVTLCRPLARLSKARSPNHLYNPIT
jgi:tRNA(Ile)-lysidine synthase TilS/MesJ